MTSLIFNIKTFEHILKYVEHSKSGTFYNYKDDVGSTFAYYESNTDEIVVIDKDFIKKLKKDLVKNYVPMAEAVRLVYQEGKIVTCQNEVWIKEFECLFFDNRFEKLEKPFLRAGHGRRDWGALAALDQRYGKYEWLVNDLDVQDLNRKDDNNEKG